MQTALGYSVQGRPHSIKQVFVFQTRSRFRISTALFKRDTTTPTIKTTLRKKKQKEYNEKERTSDRAKRAGVGGGEKIDVIGGKRGEGVR